MSDLVINKNQFYFLFSFILIITLSVTGPFFNFHQNFQDTRITLHPFESTKDVIKDRSYAIVFDGGSTGTRIHIFSFFINSDVKQGKIHLDNEMFFKTQPGLSSYSDSAENAANSLDPLLQKAFKIIPQFEAPLTPVILKATAGLRLLSGNLATQILQSVEDKLRLLPYKG